VEEKRLKKLEKQTYSFAIRVGVIFFVTSIAGVLLGNFLDTYVVQRPLGTFITMALFYIFTWIVVWRIYKQIKLDNTISAQAEKEANESNVKK
jgi:F0F1-type ATP synthase assembly protein I